MHAFPEAKNPEPRTANGALSEDYFVPLPKSLESLEIKATTLLDG
jgi:hypothetical protein